MYNPDRKNLLCRPFPLVLLFLSHDSCTSTTPSACMFFYPGFSSSNLPQKDKGTLISQDASGFPVSFYHFFLCPNPHFCLRKALHQA